MTARLVRLVRVMVLIGAVLAAGRASAEAAPYGDSDLRRWYGWQILLADAAALATVTVPVGDTWKGAVRSVGFTSLFMNGPVIHMFHDNPASASVSLARLPVFVAGWLSGLAYAHYRCRAGGCADNASVFGSAAALTPLLVFDLVTSFGGRF